MDESEMFAEQVVARVVEARRALAAAIGSADSFALQEALDELESALLCARENGVEVPQSGPDDQEIGS